MRISIVTTTLNASRYICAAVESICDQSGFELEHIVTDGGSTDGTLQALARYPHLHVDSRRDRGIYDGINRGLLLATGSVIGLLNADDLIPPGVLTWVAERFACSDAPDMLTGAVSFFDNQQECKRILVPHGPPSPAGLAFGVPAICGRFFRRELLDTIGPFDLRLPLAADRAWLMRAAGLPLRFETTERIVYRYREHEASKTLSGGAAARARIWHEHLELAPLSLGEKWCSSLCRACRELRAVEGAKLLLADAAARGGESRLALLSRLVASDRAFPVSLARGLRSWARWRGRHSDA